MSESPIRLAIRLVAVAAGLVSGPLAALGQESGQGRLDGPEGLKILNLERKLGFRQFAGPLTYLVDPRLNSPQSELYGPEAKAAAPGEPRPAGDPRLKRLDQSEWMKPVLEKGEVGDELKIHGPLRQVTDDFLKLITEGYKAPVYWSDLRHFLTKADTLTKPIDQLWITLGFRFWVRDGAPGEEALQCRLELRAFKTRIDYEQGAPNLSYCELVFQDTAIGTVLRKSYPVPADAVRAAIIDALRNRIAVNFCANPFLRLEEDQKDGGVLGTSINKIQG